MYFSTSKHVASILSSKILLGVLVYLPLGHNVHSFVVGVDVGGEGVGGGGRQPHFLYPINW